MQAALLNTRGEESAHYPPKRVIAPTTRSSGSTTWTLASVRGSGTVAADLTETSLKLPKTVPVYVSIPLSKKSVSFQRSQVDAGLQCLGTTSTWTVTPARVSRTEAATVTRTTSSPCKPVTSSALCPSRQTSASFHHHMVHAEETPSNTSSTPQPNNARSSPTVDVLATRTGLKHTKIAKPDALGLSLMFAVLTLTSDPAAQ